MSQRNPRAGSRRSGAGSPGQHGSGRVRSGERRRKALAVEVGTALGKSDAEQRRGAADDD